MPPDPRMKILSTATVDGRTYTIRDELIDPEVVVPPDMTPEELLQKRADEMPLRMDMVAGSTSIRNITDGPWTPYIRPKDMIFLVNSGVNNADVDPGFIQNLASQLKAAFPGVPVWGRTGGILNVQALADADLSVINGIISTWEDGGFIPDFTRDKNLALARIADMAQASRDGGYP